MDEEEEQSHSHTTGMYTTYIKSLITYLKMEFLFTNI